MRLTSTTTGPSPSTPAGSSSSRTRSESATSRTDVDRVSRHISMEWVTRHSASTTAGAEPAWIWLTNRYDDRVGALSQCLAPGIHLRGVDFFFALVPALGAGAPSPKWRTNAS